MNCHHGRLFETSLCTALGLLFTLANLSVCIADKPPAKQEKTKPRETFSWVNSPSPNAPAEVVHGTFFSRMLQQDVGYAMLLPPQYQSGDPQTTSLRYPVIYYLHGGRPGSEWKGVGIADHLIDQMKTNPQQSAIYVFVNGGPVSHYNVPGRQDAIGADVFIKELIPHIDAHYRTIADRTGRALEGFSQGGRGTMRLGLRHADLFCSLAAGGGGYETEKKISENNGEERPGLVFAPGDNTWDLAKDFAKTPVSDRPALMIYVGTEGFNYQNNRRFSKHLESLGIEHRLLEVPGIKHSGKKIYEAAGPQIMQFHRTNLF